MSDTGIGSGREIRRGLDQARAELASTLDALEYKLDVPARTGDWVQERKRRFARVWDEQPAVVAGVALGAVALVTAVVGGVVGFARRTR